MSQALSQEHSGFSFWRGDPFHDDESERFVARYVERGPISLQKLSVDEDLENYTTKEGKTHDFGLAWCQPVNAISKCFYKRVKIAIYPKMKRGWHQQSTKKRVSHLGKLHNEAVVTIDKFRLAWHVWHAVLN